jgi:hypothetical protein
LAYQWGRAISSGIGTFICGYILFSVKSNAQKKFRFHRISRFVAKILIWVMLISLGISIHSLISGKKTYIEYEHVSSLDISPEAWKTQPGSNKNFQNHVTYTLDINIPTSKVEFENLKVYIQTIKGFRLLHVRPKHTIQPIKKEQEPLQVGAFKDLRSEWLFPSFDNSLGWQILVDLEKVDKKLPNPKKAPLFAVFYFH